MNFIKKNIVKLPYIRNLYKQVKEYNKNSCYPPGHYYSPIVSVSEIKTREESVWQANQAVLNDIDLNIQDQLNFIKEISKNYFDLPFSENKVLENRYYFNNRYYSYTDGIILYLIIRFLNPKKIVEIGSGFSSALMLDVNEKYYQNSIDLTFIEPFTERLNSLIKDQNVENTTIIENRLQNVNIKIFKELKKGDILFIDSTHVSKTGSDVNHILFNIFPLLEKGLYIHIHDIFYPFEYPKEWVYGGRNWNEAYILRAFLMNNDHYRIKIFSDYLRKFHSGIFKNMPLMYNNTGGSLWLEKI